MSKIKDIFQFSIDKIDSKHSSLHTYYEKEYANFFDNELLELVNNKIKTLDCDQNKLKKEIFDHISTFFSRYYHKGLFVFPQFYPKKNKLLVPYDGQEMFFSWINQNQYYVRMSDNSDFFIHKDLNTFLTQELNFFIKNELLEFDKLTSKEDFTTNLLQISTFKSISSKIIDFLSQIEELQKDQLERKKFVLSTDYFITLDCIHEKFYPEILSNKEQLNEWSKLFNFELEIDFVTSKSEINSMSKTIEEIKMDLLKQNPTLVVDTNFFSETFKYQLLSELDNLDEQITGILIKSENFQALSLLLNKYSKNIDCCYIDPPYNAYSSDIKYKNDYPHSTWLSLMANRYELCQQLLAEDFVLFTAIDESEQEVLGQLLSMLFPDNEKKCLSIQHNPRGKQGKNISYTHEFAYIVYPTDKKKYLSDIKRDEIDSRNLRDSGTISDRTDAATCFYPFIVKNKKIVNVGEVAADDFHPSGSNVQKDDGSIEIWPINTKGNEKKWRYSVNSVHRIINNLEVKKGRNGLQIIYNKDTTVMRSLWFDAKYDASEYGTKLLQSMLGKKTAAEFSYPKSIFNVKDLLHGATSNNPNALVIDYFAGSGTTGHAIARLNKELGGNRKYILIEMENYFHSVLKPRIKKSIYSDNWKNVHPQDKNGFNKQIIKFQSLEQFEDALLNLENKLESMNIDQLEDPFDYKISSYSKGEPTIQKVDLIESFNYLLGIHISSTFLRNHNNSKYIFVKGHLEDNPILVVWRNKPHSFDPVLDSSFIESEVRLTDYQEIFINGNSTIENTRSIGEIFREKMFNQ